MIPTYKNSREDFPWTNLLSYNECTQPYSSLPLNEWLIIWRRKPDLAYPTPYPGKDTVHLRLAYNDSNPDEDDDQPEREDKAAQLLRTKPDPKSLQVLVTSRTIPWLEDPPGEKP